MVIKCNAYAKMYEMKNIKKDNSNSYRSYVAILQFFIDFLSRVNLTKHKLILKFHKIVKIYLTE